MINSGFEVSSPVVVPHTAPVELYNVTSVVAGATSAVTTYPLDTIDNEHHSPTQVPSSHLNALNIERTAIGWVDAALVSSKSRTVLMPFLNY